jgi:hypothetical protein
MLELETITDTMENDIMSIVQSINKNEVTTLSRKVLHFLHRVFIKSKLTSFEMNYYIKDIYKLIFYYGNENVNASVRIICGFIKFGKSSAGRNYKPMIDYFMIEAIETLLNQCGWSIIKPLLNMLYNSIPKFQEETTFNYISNKIIKQLNSDRLTMQSSQSQTQSQTQSLLISELCYTVPRERSFSFGWYSYYIACELYGNKNYYKQKIKQTHIRNYLMKYRKLINELRKYWNSETEHDNTYKTTEVYRPESFGREMNYYILQLELNKPHYKEVDKIIDSVLQRQTEVAQTPVVVQTLVQTEVQTDVVAAEAQTEVSQTLVQTEVASQTLVQTEEASQTPVVEVQTQVVSQEEEITITPQNEIKEKENINVNKNTWFSGWFSGWN